MAAAHQREELDQILGDGAVRAVYQPIVDLATGRPIAFEALTRGPEGSTLERPDLLFAAARADGRLAELEWACRSAALRGALEAGMTSACSLFVNVEPEVTGPHPRALDDLMRQATECLDVVVEVTERALVSDPAALLSMLQRLRGRGWGVALDDVGAEIESLALMPFLAPDVMKLDLRLVQQRPDGEVASIIAAVAAQVERTGSSILAEGVETPEHLMTALTMGATLGQGWLFARPGPLPDDFGAISAGVARHQSPSEDTSPSTVAAAAGSRPLRRSTKPLLIEMSKHLERQALDQGAAVVVLATFQEAKRFTPETQHRYAALAGRAAFVAALGLGMSEEPAPGVRGGHLRPDDPLVQEWTVAVIGPHFAAAFAATDLGDDGPDEQRRFDYVLTYDRDRALAVALTLMGRISAQTNGTPGVAAGQQARAVA